MPKNPIIEAIQSAGARNVRLIQDVEFLRTLEGSVARPGLIPDAMSIQAPMQVSRLFEERSIGERPQMVREVQNRILQEALQEFIAAILRDIESVRRVGLPSSVDLRPMLPPITYQMEIGSATSSMALAEQIHAGLVSEVSMGARADWVRGELVEDQGTIIRQAIETAEDLGVAPRAEDYVQPQVGHAIAVTGINTQGNPPPARYLGWPLTAYRRANPELGRGSGRSRSSHRSPDELRGSACYRSGVPPSRRPCHAYRRHPRTPVQPHGSGPRRRACGLQTERSARHAGAVYERAPPNVLGEDHGRRAVLGGVSWGMLLDLTRYPLVVFPDECQSSVVIRTRTTREVSGSVRMEDPDTRDRRKGVKLVEVQPTASLQERGDTYSETKLPLHRWDDISQFAAVFEASSAAKDTLTGTGMSWRVQVGIVRKETGLWSVAVIDMVKSIPLVMVSIRGLGERGIHDEPVPLARVVKSKLRASEPTFWDRIADDD